jgi:hypothetical protein
MRAAEWTLRRIKRLLAHFLLFLLDFNKTRIFFTDFRNKNSHAPLNDVSFNDPPQIRRWSHNIIIFLNFALWQDPMAKRGSRRLAVIIRDLGARRGWVVSTTPRPLYPRKRPGTHCTRGWVDPRAGLDLCEKSRPHRNSIPRPFSP